MKINKKTKGFTLVEILLVLGLVAIMGIGMYVQLARSEAETESMNEVQSIMTIFDSVERVFVSTGQYQNISIDSLKSIGLDVNSGVGNAGLKLATLSSTSPTRLEATYENVSRKSCGLITSKVVNTGTTHSVLVNGIKVTNGTSIDDIVKECINDVNTLVVIRENNTSGVILRVNQDGITDMSTLIPNDVNACPTGVCEPSFALPAKTNPGAWNNTINSGAVTKPTVDTTNTVNIGVPVFTPAPSLSPNP